MACKIPPPSQPSTSSPSDAAKSSLVVGASAAVVGREAALQGVQSLSIPDSGDGLEAEAPLTSVGDLEKEMVELEALEQELQAQQQALEEEDRDALEIQELDRQILELELEDQQLQHALNESAAMANGVRIPETIDGHDCRKQKPAKPARKLADHHDDDYKILPLEPKVKKLYEKYWSRFVATPQNHGRSVKPNCILLRTCASVQTFKKHVKGYS